MRFRVLLLCDDRPSHADTVLSHIAALSEATDHHVFKFNPRGWLAAEMIDVDEFDVIIVHYSIAIIFETYLPKIVRDAVRRFTGLKLLFIQDEYRDVNRCVSSMIDLGIHVIFTCVPEPQISKVYRHLLEHSVRCVETLTGFVPNGLARRPVSPLAARPFDVVYRGRPCPYELGDLAQEKVSIAVRFNELAPKFGLTADVDWREEARIYGECWPEFMASGRTALGTESCASIVDFDGELARTVAAYREQYPEASYREVADKFLAPYEGNVVINTISPRAFEAIALRTALVLFPGSYSGVLQAGRHYIPLAKDFSNFAEVAGLLKNTAFLEQMAAITFDEVVAPGQYSYAAFARSVDAVMEEEWQARIAPTAKRRSLLFDAEKWRAKLTAQVSAILKRYDRGESRTLPASAAKNSLTSYLRTGSRMMKLSCRIARKPSASLPMRTDSIYNILIVYWYNAPTMRVTTYDHLYCFERHLNHRIFYVNLEHETLPQYVTEVEFDLIVFHDLFFCGRWGGPPLFHKLCKRIEFLRNYPAVKIAIPQDEFISADLLCEFINDFDVRAVFSVSPTSEWPKIYRNVDRDRVKFYCVLTGYLEDLTLANIERLSTEVGRRRDVDIGYRAGGRDWRQASWLGRHGILKIEIGDRVAAAAVRFGIKTDISSRAQDVFMGDDWYRFLLRSKYTIGLEGGASILDWDGTVRAKTLTYVEEHPEATLKEIEAACFPGLDGTFALFALSPRHLEACATRTCQILVEGNFNGVLKPWVHYLPVTHDFSNLDEILQIVKEDKLRAEIVERAYEDIVASKRYTYRAFAKFVISETERIAPNLRPRSNTLRAAWQHVRAKRKHSSTNAAFGSSLGSEVPLTARLRHAAGKVLRAASKVVP